MNSVSNFLTPDGLTAYYQKHWGEFSKEKMGNPGRNPKEGAALGYTIYIRSMSKGLGIAVIGPNRLRDDLALVENVGSVLGNSSIKIKKLSKEASYQFAGAILGEKQWSGIINDLFMLGAVHANKEFHFSIPAVKTLKLADLWNAEKQVLTTTGRELLLLLIAGYASVPLKNKLEMIFGQVFVPPAAGRLSISLEEYRNAIHSFQDPQKILNFFYSGAELR